MQINALRKGFNKECHKSHNDLQVTFAILHYTMSYGLTLSQQILYGTFFYVFFYFRYSNWLFFCWLEPIPLFLLSHPVIVYQKSAKSETHKLWPSAWKSWVNKAWLIGRSTEDSFCHLQCEVSLPQDIMVESSQSKSGKSQVVAWMAMESMNEINMFDSQGKSAADRYITS